MFEQVQREERAPVVVVARAADADLLVTTLGVHGIDASVSSTSVFPSLDFVEGRAVVVELTRWSEAAHLLRGLGHEPLPAPTGPATGG